MQKAKATVPPEHCLKIIKNFLRYTCG